jgi:hypothetical protein
MTEIKPSDEKRPAVFPALPMAAFLLVAAGTLAVLVLPLIYSRRDFAPEEACWFGHTFAGRCLLSARILPFTSESDAAEALELTLTIDNSRGNEPVKIECSGARFYTMNGMPIAALRGGELSVSPGEEAKTASIVFPAEIIRGNADRLSTLQIKADGAVLNLPGMYFRNTEDLDAEYGKSVQRQRGLPEAAGD